jgi:CRISPR-associated protein Cas2
MKEYWLICYDINDDRRRSRIASLLESCGERVNYSVFEVLASRKTMEDLKRKLLARLRPETDRIHFYPLCLKDFCKAERYGLPYTPEETDMICNV